MTLFKLLSSAYQYIKSIFITPVKPKQEIELRPSKPFDYSPYRNKVTRPKWCAGLFDDYIYGRIKSMSALDAKIKETHYNNPNRRFLRN